VVAAERRPAPIRPLDADYRVLDQFAGGLVDEAPRIEAIATISAGFKNEKGLPQRSVDGRICLHDPDGRAPELRRALEATDFKRLTVAFPFNHPAAFVQQRFAAYSASALRAYGDETAITVLEGKRQTFAAGTDGYTRWVAECKVQASIFFCLSEWVDAETPLVSMPDGLGYYRLRTTSRNSLRSILSQLRYAARFTHDRIAGLPFTLSIEQRDVAGADGKRQRVPVWVMVTQPPGGVHLTSRTFAAIARRALDEGEALYLEPPAPETVETALLEAGTPLVVDDDELAIGDEEAGRLATGAAPCDAAYWNTRWHAVASGTPYAGETARHAFVAAFSAMHGPVPTDSLAGYLAVASEADAMALLSALEIATQNGPADEPLSDEELDADLLVDDDLPVDLPPPPLDPEPEPAPAVPDFDPATVKVWFAAQVSKRGGEGALQVPWDRARAIGDLLASVLQSLGAGIDIARYLTDKPTASFQGLTYAEADALETLANRPKAREKLMAVHALAKAWAKAQPKPVAAEPAALA
jgi:hypothetical protein